MSQKVSRRENEQREIAVGICGHFVTRCEAWEECCPLGVIDWLGSWTSPGNYIEHGVVGTGVEPTKEQVG